MTKMLVSIIDFIRNSIYFNVYFGPFDDIYSLQNEFLGDLNAISRFRRHTLTILVFSYVETNVIFNKMLPTVS